MRCIAIGCSTINSITRFKRGAKGELNYFAAAVITCAKVVRGVSEKKTTCVTFEINFFNISALIFFALIIFSPSFVCGVVWQSMAMGTTELNQLSSYQSTKARNHLSHHRHI